MNPGREERPIVWKRHIAGGGDAWREGFTLVELVVVISVIAVLMGVLVPAVNKARWQARRVLGASNQRAVVQGVNYFAADNDESYPESVATVGSGKYWSWQK